jgi:hypothetical protein
MRLRSLTCALLLASTGVLSASTNDWRSRFEAEAPAAWDEYRHANQFAQGVCRGQKSEFEVKRNERCRFARTTELTSGKTELFVENSQYRFQLKSGKDGGWVMTSYHRLGQPENAAAEQIRLRLERYFLDIDQAVREDVDHTSLSEIVRSPRTQIADVKLLPNRLIEAKLAFDPDPQEKRQKLGMTLVLDPARNWLPLSQTVIVRNRAGTGSHTSELIFQDGAFPQPSRISWRQEYALVSQAEQWKEEGVWICSMSVPKRLPEDEEFRLSAFGLPEPPEVTWEKRSSRYIWLLVAAGLFAVLAVVFRYLARHRFSKSLREARDEPTTGP